MQIALLDLRAWREEALQENPGTAFNGDSKRNANVWASAHANSAKHALKKNL
jgi:hypothetical protein